LELKNAHNQLRWLENFNKVLHLTSLLQGPDQASRVTPRHVGIIMDGNGRWARSRFMPRIWGHKRGADSVREVVKAAASSGVQVLSLFAFSDENWGRPVDEVSALMGLFDHYLSHEINELKRQNIKLRVMGNLDRLPVKTKDLLIRGCEDLSSCTGMVLNLAVSYGARAEITEAVRDIAQRIREGLIDPEHIDESLFASHLATAGLPDLDLVIRTSGEQRLSNFMLWQCSYAELYFTNVQWPDFRAADFDNAVHEFSSRQRRFGLVAPAASDVTVTSDSYAGEASC
jgi:undecaprenyl diphosphate synthase